MRARRGAATSRSVSLLLLLAIAAGAEDYKPVPRKLADVYFGDRLEDVRRLYPPAAEWPSYVEPRGQVKRYRLARQYLKTPEQHVDTMFVGFKNGGVVEVQLIYTSAATASTPVERLVRELELDHGPTHRSGSVFYWNDGRTVMRAFYEPVQVLRDGREATELRTSLQVAEAALYR